jgi:hypothetical protein
MNDSEKFFLFVLESATPAQLKELLAIAKERGVPLAEVVEEAVNLWLTREFEELDEGAT